jgi:predicted DNA binding CopG/RHH family protein
MKKTKLDKDELDVVRGFERGEWGPVKDIEAQKKKAVKAARATLSKDRRINIRISSKDLDDFRKKAFEEGIPYQTLMASVLHKYATGRLKEKGV